MDRARIQEMLTLQASMNAKVNPEWRTAGYAWHRAIMVEGSEAMEHHGWKWWKKQTPDIAQLRIELVDIWHFMLSHILTYAGSDEKAENFIHLGTVTPQDTIWFDGTTYTIAEMPLLDKIGMLVGCAAGKRVSIPVFASLMADVGMDWDSLYTGYVAKNVLNFFRQDHGYKDGAYIKMWDGEEDNVRLEQIVLGMDPKSETFIEDLRAELTAQYRTVLWNSGRTDDAANM